MSFPISHSWTRIIDWLRANAPVDDLDVFAPATRDMIASSEAKIGIVFPEQLIEFYQRLDGADSGSVFPSPDNDYEMAFTPMPLQDVAAKWAGQKNLFEVGQFDDRKAQSVAAIRDVWWDVGWIPFADNGGGDLLCVDTAPTAAGQNGQLISHAHETGQHKLLSPSLADYLHDLATKMEQGQFAYDDKYGLVPLLSPGKEIDDKTNDVFTGMSEWHYANALIAGEEAFKKKDYALCVAHLERFESRLDKLPASRLAFAKKKVGEGR